jgi:hypothetical protein
MPVCGNTRTCRDKEGQRNFQFGKILADLNPIHKIPKFYISSAHSTNFQFCQISGSGTLSTLLCKPKLVTFHDAISIQASSPSPIGMDQ